MQAKLKRMESLISPLQYEILECLSTGSKIREDLVKELNTSRTTVYDNLEKLENKGIIFKSSISNGCCGRPPVHWQIKQAHDLVLFNVITKKIGVIGSGEYKKKKIVIRKLEQLIDKQRDIIVSGHSPRNPIFKDGILIRYNNADIWSEDWAYVWCQNPPIIHPTKEFTRDGFFARNKLIALDSEELIVFINKHQYQSGAWNTVKYFLEKPDFDYNNLTIYDEFGKEFGIHDLPEWCQNKIKIPEQETQLYKYLSQIRYLKSLEKEKKKQKKSLNPQKKEKDLKSTKSLNKINSYILNNRNSKITKFALEEIDKYTYFRTTTISKIYIKKILKINNINGTLKRSVSNKIGQIVGELRKLGIIIMHSKSTWKNLHKDQLHVVLSEKMKKNYNKTIKKG